MASDQSNNANLFSGANNLSKYDPFKPKIRRGKKQRERSSTALSLVIRPTTSDRAEPNRTEQ